MEKIQRRVLISDLQPQQGQQLQPGSPTLAIQEHATNLGTATAQHRQFAQRGELDDAARRSAPRLAVRLSHRYDISSDDTEMSDIPKVWVHVFSDFML